MGNKCECVPLEQQEDFELYCLDGEAHHVMSLRGIKEDDCEYELID